MVMTMRRLAMAAALIAAAPAWAADFRAANRLRVAPVDDQVFEVIAGPGMGGSAFWCAAGDYANRVMGAGATQRIYLVRARGPAVTRNRKSAAHFSLVPPDGVDTSPGYFLSLRRVGENLTANDAQSHCVDPHPNGY